MNALVRPSSSEYFVFSADGRHVGPVSADLIARGVAAGKVPGDGFVALAGTTHWLPLVSVPEIASALEPPRSSAPPPEHARVAQSTFVLAPRPAPVPKELTPAPIQVPKTEKKDVLDPRARLLPLAIFGGCALIGFVEAALTLAFR